MWKGMAMQPLVKRNRNAIFWPYPRFLCVQNGLQAHGGRKIWVRFGDCVLARFKKNEKEFRWYQETVFVLQSNIETVPRAAVSWHLCAVSSTLENSAMVRTRRAQSAEACDSTSARSLRFPNCDFNEKITQRNKSSTKQRSLRFYVGEVTLIPTLRVRNESRTIKRI